MNKLRKANKTIIGGAMALNTLPLIGKGANATTAMNSLQGGIGIGVTGIITDKMFDLQERKRKRKRKY